MYDNVISGAISGKNYFISGPGGTGKSYLISKLAEILKESHEPSYGAPINVNITATTGIAAFNLNEKLTDVGLICTTIHSFGGLGMGNKTVEGTIGDRYFTKNVIKRWRTTDVLIIDEISMMGGSLFEKMNVIAKTVRDSQRPFGGISVIVSGDFCQLPPINDYWVFESSAWDELNFETIELTEPKRYPNLEYFQLLSRFRLGEQTEEDYQLLQLRHEKTLEYLGNPTNEIQPAYLSSKKDMVEKLNGQKLNELEGRLYSYAARDTKKYICGDRGNVTRHKNMLDKIVPQTLKLKVGAQILLKMNIDVPGGLVNGTRGVITKLGNDCIEIKTYNGIFVIERQAYSFKCEEFTYTRMQFPIILAFALTIHSTQGLTLDAAICDLGKNVFADGQAYVAMSRVKDIEGLYIRSLDRSAFKTSKRVIAYYST